MKLFNFLFVLMIFAVISCTNNETQTTPTEEVTDTVTVSTQVEGQGPELQSEDTPIE